MKFLFNITAGASRIEYCWQKKQSHFLAIRADNNLTIYDRLGECISKITLSSESHSMEWSPHGDYFVATQHNSSFILIWDSYQRKWDNESFDSKMKHSDFLTWSPDGKILLISNDNGHILFHKWGNNADSLPIIGKHSKKIVSGAWSLDNRIALASEDKTISISNTQGDTLKIISLKGEPSQLKWFHFHNSEQEVLSAVLSKNNIYIYGPETELTLQYKHGQISKYYWFDNGNIAIGFCSGTVIILATESQNIGQEIFQGRNHKDSLDGMAISLTLNQLATCGDNLIKIHDLRNLKDVIDIVTLDEDRGKLDNVQWSEDGQFLTVSTKNGKIRTFLSKLPCILGSYEKTTAWLSSMNEISLKNIIGTETAISKKKMDFEPSFLGIGPNHLAVGFNNMCIFSPIKDIDASWKKEYMSTIKSVSLNDKYVSALLTEGRLYIHELEKSSESEFSLVLPVKSEKDIITCSSINKNFLVYGTENGIIRYVLSGDWAVIHEYRHECGIRSIFPHPNGARLIFIDSTNNSFVLNPVANYAINIFGESNCKTVLGSLWDTEKKSIFITWDNSIITLHKIQSHSLSGARCQTLGSSKLPFSLNPVLIADGKLYCVSTSGKLEVIELSVFKDPESNIVTKNEDEQGAALRQLYFTEKSESLWKFIPIIKSRRSWTMVAESALTSLDLKTSKRIYQQILADAGMVLTITRLENIDDRNELCGHIATIFSDFDSAQNFFLASQNPKEALYLRHDLRQWDQALTLSKTLAPEEITIISKEYAYQLELDGKYSEALGMYKMAQSNLSTCTKSQDYKIQHDRACQEGIIRTSLYLGDISNGMRLLSEHNSKSLLLDCANILESLKQYTEAASLLEKLCKWDQAAQQWAKGNNWNRVGMIIKNVTNVHVLSAYAKAKEDEGKYAESTYGYEKAQDYDNLVRVLIDHMKDVHSAVLVVRKTHSRDSAKLVVKYFKEIQEYKPVIEFCLLAGLEEEAFQIAKQFEYVDYYAELVKDEASFELSNISNYFELKGKFILSGKYHLYSGSYERALQMFIRAASLDVEAIEMAIETVGQAKNEKLTQELINFLMGEIDGIPKDAKYIFKLYMSLGKFKEAARTSVIIAREEQILGNYRAAHDLLYENYHQLRITNAKIPSEIDRMLMLIHSYILVKILIKMEDHYKGARMLIRVASNISKFPSHTVPILTSTVIEAYRAGLKQSAFDYAAILMRPENRQNIDAKFKRKIEQIIRRPEKDEIEEENTPCPFCMTLVPETSLSCEECKNTIPYCIITGRHMVLSEWSQCKYCMFPALYSHFKAYLVNNPECPMCCHLLKENEIFVMKDAKACLKIDNLENVPEEEEIEMGMKRSTQHVDSESSLVGSSLNQIDAPGMITDFAGIGGLVA